MQNEEFAKHIPNSNEFLDEKKKVTEDDSKTAKRFTTGRQVAQREKKRSRWRERMNLFMESRGERSLKFLSEENFIMTDNRGRDE